MAFRFYSFVAHHYLSPLQCGIQTAHAVSELSIQQTEQFGRWANEDKTIIICGAGNQAGVVQAWEEFRNFSVYHNIPIDLTLFREDQQSMNEMVTACGIIVSDYYYGATLADMSLTQWIPPIDGQEYTPDELQFVRYLKSFRLV